MKWEPHKPRVFRVYATRCRATVSPSLERREWIWVIERINGLGHTSERARGRAGLRRDAMQIAWHALILIDDLETEASQRRYMPK